ncbi:MAG: hypothetical protein MUO19_08670 [Dehalococcoidales bacterium]|nr:hypothetical protein [Dehalococcoidales bacterium]
MRKICLLLLAVILVALPALSSCDINLFGGKSSEQQEYERQVESWKAQQEADQKAQEQYYQEQLEAYQKYLEEYAEWEAQQKLLEAQ